MDDADAKIQQAIDDGIACVRRELHYALLPCGVCYYCKSSITASKVFCDKYCSDDWNYEKQRLKDLGK